MYRTLLVGLDGSELSAEAGRLCLRAAAEAGAKVIACHVYGANLHMRRFMEMEPGLPQEFRHPKKLDHLRHAHDSLIRDGFASLSCGYMDAFMDEAAAAGVEAERAVVEGRNFQRILDVARDSDADLIALGAGGLGSVGDGQLGSVAARVLRAAGCDVLIARAREPENQGTGACAANSAASGPVPVFGPVLACIDGSAHALAAAKAGVWWASTLTARLRLAAAYDPDFHADVFQAMGRALSEERRREVGLDQQQDLHDRLIDQGLATLYQGFLDDAGRHAGNGTPPPSALLAGKAYRVINRHAAETGAGLIVAGRFGHHHEGGGEIGASAEVLARTAPCNVLLTAPRESATGAARPGRAAKPSHPGHGGADA